LRSSADHPNKPALIDGSTHRTITYGRLHDDLRRAAAGLVRRGVQRGDVVAVFGPNSPDSITAFYAVTSLGAIITSLNVIHNVAELSYQLIDSGAKVVLVTCDPTPALVRAAEKAGITRLWRLDDVREDAESGDTDAYLTTLDARPRSHRSPTPRRAAMCPWASWSRMST
jgi:acyl-CoA synthetase (AMP-forming)/AMP-acid ligase II